MKMASVQGSVLAISGGREHLLPQFKLLRDGRVAARVSVQLGASTATRTVSPLAAGDQKVLTLVAFKAQHPVLLGLNAGTAIKCQGTFLATTESATLTLKSQAANAGGNVVELLFAAQGTVL